MITIHVAIGNLELSKWGEHKRATAHSLHEHRRTTSRLKWFYLWDKPSAIPETALWKNEKATFSTYRRQSGHYGKVLINAVIVQVKSLASAHVR